MHNRAIKHGPNIPDYRPLILIDCHAVEDRDGLNVNVAYLLDLDILSFECNLRNITSDL